MESNIKKQKSDRIRPKRDIHSDMTDGNIIRQLLYFSWPLFTGNIFQQLYTTVSAIILGKYIGSEALAAIGVFAPLNNLLLGLFIGTSVGATVMVSQSYGAHDSDKLNQSILVSIWLSVIGGILITILGIISSRFVLTLIGTPESIFGMANDYSQTMFLGLLPMFFYNILSGALRGMGDSVTPLLFLIFSNLVNAALLYLFVVVLGLGIRSAAYATIIAETTAGLITFIYLLRSQKKYGLQLSGLKPDWSIARRLLGIGLPAGLQTSIFSIGFMLQQNLINQFGPVVIAAYTVVTRLDQFVMMPMNSFATAITTFVGQNIGARKMERTVEGIKKTLFLSQLLTIVLVSILFIFGDNIMAMFIQDAEVMNTGTTILRTLSLGYVLVNSYIILMGAVRGAGDTIAPLMASVICNVFLRVILAYSLVQLTGSYLSIFVAIVFAWSLASLFMITYYRKGIWRKKIPWIV